ncbi:MAG TPA: hypothetical protein PLB89_09880 [Flavobacteriales bacterium]|nr:hypothetical protein [Flavobacteriales bacterium]
MNAVFSAEQRKVLLRIYFGWILLALLWRWMDVSMLSQLEAPVLGNVYKDLTFWLFQLLGIQDGLTAHSGIALVFDIILTASVVLALARPNGVWYPRIYCTAILLYFVTHTTYANHHYRPIIGLLFAGIPFAFRSLDRFGWSFQALRYYVLFLYTSAGLYKVFRGSWLNMDQMTNIIENTQLELLLTHGDGWHAQLFTWLLVHEWAGWALFFACTVMETLFIIGFFTRRWDVALFCAAITLHIGFYFTMGFFAFELIVLDLTLLPWGRILQSFGATTKVAGASPSDPTQV